MALRLAGVAAAVALLGACGGDDDPATSNADTSAGAEQSEETIDGDAAAGDGAASDTVETEGTEGGSQAETSTDEADADSQADDGRNDDRQAADGDAASNGDPDTAAGADDDESATPPIDPAPALALAERLGATRMVAVLADDTAVIVDDGVATEVPLNGGSLWSDGRFVYRWSVADDGEPGTAALLYDGTVVCQTDGVIDHVTERVDGTYVMAVEYPPENPEEPVGEGEDVYLFDAVDCATGERQPIEPITFYGGDGEYRFVERVAGREFTGYGDAEGNADIVNERGVSINGDDYAGYHTFNDDASVVVYGDMAAGAGPHFSAKIIVRDTETGEELSAASLDAVFQRLFFVDDRLLVTFSEDIDAILNGASITDSAVVIDPRSGTTLDEVDVGFDLIYAG